MTMMFGNDAEPLAAKELNSIEQLTPRQKEIVNLLLLNGYSYKQIGENLNISLCTVRAHLHSAYKKLQVRSRGQAAAKIFSQLGK